jgi:hypothetical protein
MTAIIIPFGKHKGKTVEEVQALDPQYLEFLNMQDWMREKFPSILAAAAALNGVKSEDTPSHNAIQLKFLDDDFVMKFSHLATGHNGVYAPRVLMETSMGWDCRVCINRPEGWYYFIDVEIKPHISDDYPSILRTINRRREATREKMIRLEEGRSRVRLNESTHEVIVARSVGSAVATEDQVRTYFANDKVRLLLVSEIEHHVLPRIIKRRPK